MGKKSSVDNNPSATVGGQLTMLWRVERNVSTRKEGTRCTLQRTLQRNTNARRVAADATTCVASFRLVVGGPEAAFAAIQPSEFSHTCVRTLVRNCGWWPWWRVSRHMTRDMHRESMTTRPPWVTNSTSRTSKEKGNRKNCDRSERNSISFSSLTMWWRSVG